MEFRFNRDKKSLLNVLKSKAVKQNLKTVYDNDKIQISLEPGKFNKGEDSIPVTFKGKVTEENGNSIISGKFSYGFYLYSLVIFAAVLIIARFTWSAIQKQLDNMILCGIVTALLIIVVVVVYIKSKNARTIIIDFLKNLNKK